MDLDKFNEWYDNINTNQTLRNRGLYVNSKEAWLKGVEEERERILEIIGTVSIYTRSCIDPATSDTIVLEILTRIYNEMLDNYISTQDFKEFIRKD